MNKIIEFLESNNHNIDDYIYGSPVDKDNLSRFFHQLRLEIKSYAGREEIIVKNKRKPTIQRGQIWLCKQKYYDSFGSYIVGNHPYLVLIVSNKEVLYDKTFIRVQPITPFIEFKSDDDILIEEDNITGFPFIIETWNDQPILTDLLYEYVGYLNINTINIDNNVLKLSKIQRGFRKVEIRNTAYLRQSINSLLEYEELNIEKTIFLNIDNSIHYPKLLNIEDKSIPLNGIFVQAYLQAAKKGKLKDRPTYYFEEKINGVNIIIKIIKDEDEYILSIKEPENSETKLKDLKGNILKQTSTNLYEGLKSGIYFIHINGMNSEIRIILR